MFLSRVLAFCIFWSIAIQLLPISFIVKKKSLNSLQGPVGSTTLCLPDVISIFSKCHYYLPHLPELYILECPVAQSLDGFSSLATLTPSVTSMLQLKNINMRTPFPFISPAPTFPPFLLLNPASNF